MQIIAHRGASRDAPENTIAAFDLALAMGCRALETDVRLTADGVAVLLHDPTVDRMTLDGHGPVDRLTWSQVRALTVRAHPAHARLADGPPDGPAAAGVRLGIAGLGEFLDRYLEGPLSNDGGTPIQLVIELKAPGTPEAVCAELARRPSGVCLDRIVLTSFDAKLLQQARRLLPATGIGLLTRAITLSALETCSRLNADQICPDVHTLTPQGVEVAHREGLRVRVWGVRGDLHHLRQAWEHGADGATTDAPGLALRAMETWLSARAGERR